MASDADKIHPDSPPSDPTAPRVNPDPAPAQPFPVNVNPDPAPAAPIPVVTNPDPQPAQPFSVRVNLDPPPAGPIPVQVNLDPAPAQPFPVVTSPDPGPAQPLSVVVNPDPPPGSPRPVGVNLDPDPGQPRPMNVIPDPPPAAPFQVGVPAPYVPPQIPTPDAIVSTFLKFEREVAKFILSGIGISGDVVAGKQGDPGSRALDPIFLATWYRDVLGATKMASFVALQTILYGMNDTVAKAFNPTYFLDMSRPGSMGSAHAALDVALGNTNVTVAQGNDTILTAKSLTAPEPDGPSRNAFWKGRRSDQGQDFTVDDMVDKAVDGSGQGTFLADVPGNTNGMPSFKRFDSTKYFERSARGPEGRSETKASVQALITSAVVHADNSLFNSEQRVGVVRMGVQGEEEDGTVRTRVTVDPSAVVDDDRARVPLSFTDLRKDPITNTWRSVYFHAFNLQLAESYSPEFNELTAFGRVDPVLTYVKTGRTVSLAWEVMAFVPEDIERMYNKMMWLTSMVYPSYTSDGLMLSGPVVRFRVGDVIASESGGLPGVIKSLNFDFNEAIWELKRGMKVPRSFNVSTELQVLHDGPVGILDGAFGVLQLPSIGKQAAQDTNQAPVNNGASNAARVLPGRFARFGEPVRRS